jgi:hypothetical protein
MVVRDIGRLGWWQNRKAASIARGAPADRSGPFPSVTCASGRSRVGACQVSTANSNLLSQLATSHWLSRVPCSGEFADLGHSNCVDRRMPAVNGKAAERAAAVKAAISDLKNQACANQETRSVTFGASWWGGGGRRR